MNIEIANRLVELRKKSGLSQEELAAKLGLSRQAVSKWERAEASPDTDNLICLAKIYGVSLDDLLNTDQPVEEIAEEVKDRQELPKSESGQRAFDWDSPEGKIRIVVDPGDPDEDSVHAYIEDEERKCYRQGKYCFVLKKEEAERKKKMQALKNIFVPITAFLAAIFYVVCGFTLQQYQPVWQSWWTVFMLIVLVGSIFEAIEKRRTKELTGVAVAISVTTFILLGFYLSVWHIAWVVFFLIPLTGVITTAIDDAHKGNQERYFYRIEL